MLLTEFEPSDIYATLSYSELMMHLWKKFVIKVRNLDGSLYRPNFNIIKLNV